MKNKEILARLTKTLKKQWVSLLLIILFSIGAVFATLYLPVLVGRAIDCIISAGNVDFPAV